MRAGIVAVLLVLAAGPALAAKLEPVSLPTWDPIFQNDSAVRMVVARLGLPDYAEVVPLSVGSPWVAWELRAYYVGSNQMLVFMRADVSGNEISVLRSQGPIPPRSIGVGAPAARGDASVDPEILANEAEAKAAAAESAAARAELIAERMATAFERSLIKK